MSGGEGRTSLRDRVIEALRSVHDPEIPVNIFDLGLVYDLRVNEEGRVDIRMTLTAPNCPVADQIVSGVASGVRSVAGVRDVDVVLVWEPAWTADRMSELARLELLAMGIDPDRAKETGRGRTTSLTLGRRPTGRR